MIPKQAQRVEMVDGRVYFSTDNWQTVYVVPRGGKARRITGRAADLARFLNIHANPAYADGPQAKRRK